jgi:hypothetical protein
MDMKAINDFFQTTPRLAELCTQNGWPDPQSLQVDLLEQIPGEILCSVSFDEVVMEGAGCEAGRVPCWGRYRVKVNMQNKIIDALLE